ncbi:hypothetical protein [Microbacterium sp. TWP3-1-2b2]|uniref:hypothetical protein n=1 Tax=Microbacterium sp. TWP3-1-2b2 TaxID=2804651 RepID=UPI003CF6AEF6
MRTSVDHDAKTIPPDATIVRAVLRALIARLRPAAGALRVVMAREHRAVKAQALRVVRVPARHVAMAPRRVAMAVTRVAMEHLVAKVVRRSVRVAIRSETARRRVAMAPRPAARVATRAATARLAVTVEALRDAMAATSSVMARPLDVTGLHHAATVTGQAADTRSVKAAIRVVTALLAATIAAPAGAGSRSAVAATASVLTAGPTTVRVTTIRSCLRMSRPTICTPRLATS